MCITLVFVTGKMVAAQLSSIISWLVCEQIMTMDVMWKGGKKKWKYIFTRCTSCTVTWLIFSISDNKTRADLWHTLYTIRSFSFINPDFLPAVSSHLFCCCTMFPACILPVNLFRCQLERVYQESGWHSRFTFSDERQSESRTRSEYWYQIWRDPKS